MTVHIHVDLGSLERSEGGVVTGRIHIEWGTQAFPDRDWNDFVVVVLSWWSRALSSLDHEWRTLPLVFMDGPMKATLKRTSKGMELELVGARPPSMVVTLDDVLETVTQAAKDVLEHCDSQGWTDRDVETLRRELFALEAFSRRLASWS